MTTLRLPPAVYDDSLSDFLTRIGGVDAAQNGGVEVDFQDVQFYVPVALAALLAVVHRWLKQLRPVTFLHCDVCPARRYLQRMDFFALSGVTLSEDFRRHATERRFVELRRIDGGLTGRVDQLCEEMAACVFPALADEADPERAGPLDLLAYAASELITNIIQHARGTGYVAAQSYPKQGLVALGIADCGIGIRQSFSETAPEFWDPKMSDLDAVRTALQPRASSKAHLPSGWGGRVNEGVGLSMLKAIADSAGGVFTLSSGTGFYQDNHRDKRPWPIEIQLLESYPGTVSALLLPKEKLGNVQELLLDAKHQLGLLRKEHPFDNLFS